MNTTEKFTNFYKNRSSMIQAGKDYSDPEWRKKLFGLANKFNRQDCLSLCEEMTFLMAEGNTPPWSRSLLTQAQADIEAKTAQIDSNPRWKVLMLMSEFMESLLPKVETPIKPTSVYDTLFGDD